MKKLAARDFEDLLQVSIMAFYGLRTNTQPPQCAIPVFDGLLPEPFNGLLQTLLYRVAEWHALAKLRMHTENSLSWLDLSTKTFGRLMREFRDKTSTYNTVELPHEAAARDRAAQRRAQASGGQTETNPGATSAHPQSSSARRPRKLNLNTYKFHSLGDYVASIRLFGTTDSYSTQMVREFSPLSVE